jgi:hypothetical protein
MKGWFTRHKKDPNSEYLDIPSNGIITDLKVDHGTLYIFKSDGVWKLTKQGCRKIRKTSGLSRLFDPQRRDT